MTHQFTPEYAYGLDQKDPLASFRDQFYLPYINEEHAIYFLGNSLGLQPRTTQDEVIGIMENWANFGVEGFFMGDNPWLKYEEKITPLLAPIVGAQTKEVVLMNHLTVNLHLMMASFYKPTATKYKIVCEAKAFPSDQYAFQSQVKWHGFNPADAIIEVHPKEGSTTITNEDISAVVKEHGDSIALILFSGVNYLNGQIFDIEFITQLAHSVNAYAGFDLAHAAGNIKLKLHDWQVDFAVWCNYKYLNCGPGAIGGAFVHEKHLQNHDIKRLEGWWGNDEKNRFKMEPTFTPSPNANAWQMSTAPMFMLAAAKSSLEIFEQAGFENCLTKQQVLQSFLLFCLAQINENDFAMLTPQNAMGCQVSMVVHKNPKAVFDELLPNGIFADWREPNVIRIAPVPMYNTFSDIYNFCIVFKEILKSQHV